MNSIFLGPQELPYRRIASEVASVDFQPEPEVFHAQFQVVEEPNDCTSRRWVRRTGLLLPQ
ncbi:hypothetical protein [Micromonospora sp. LOL_023]|uniref:hypothetical protein n=1 Tax=Micromonospora sp. LOL_023 TaxID=3345418 RepID=UPI003A846828